MQAFTLPEENDATKRALEERCDRLGYETARASGDTGANDELLRALDAKATAMALVAHRAPSEARDQRRLTRLKTLDETLKRRIIDRDRAAVESAAAQKRLAALGTRPASSSMSPVFRYAATLGLTVSIAPTFHDLVVGLDPFLKWTIAAICAWGVSLLLVHGILPTDSSKGEPKQ